MRRARRRVTGAIDDARIYDRALTQEEIAALIPNGAIFWRGQYHLFYIYQENRARIAADARWAARAVGVDLRYPVRADSTGVSVFAAGGAARVREAYAWQMAPSNMY